MIPGISDRYHHRRSSRVVEAKGIEGVALASNAEEWLNLHKGQAQATMFIGGASARTFDFTAGGTAVNPDNAGHYIENIPDTEDIVWIEIRSRRVENISLMHWLALTPADVAANMLNLKIDNSIVQQLKKEKQLLVKGT